MLSRVTSIIRVVLVVIWRLGVHVSADRENSRFHCSCYQWDGTLSAQRLCQIAEDVTGLECLACRGTL